VSTVMDWLAKGAAKKEPYPAFTEQYARAREAQAELYADEIVDIADDDRNDYGFKESEDGTGKSGIAIIMPDNVQRSKLRVDARKWVASKLLPKKYGDKIQATHTGPDDKPLTFTINIGDAGPEAD
jgi:hypothetical protein